MAEETAQAGRGYWERHAGGYDGSMRLLGRPMAAMAPRLSEAVKGMRVLEVAAGTGLVTEVLAGSASEVVATDYAESMVERLRVRTADMPNVSCRQADLYTLPFDPGSFDAVVAANVLHLVPDLPGALASLRAVVKPGGRVLVPTFLHDQTAFSWTLSRLLALTGFPGHRRFSAVSLHQALADQGLMITREEVLPGPIPIGYVEGRFAQTIRC